MSEEPVSFGLLPAGNVTFSKNLNSKLEKGKIYRDFCGNHTHVSQDNNCNFDYSRSKLLDAYKKECANKTSCSVDLTAPINMLDVVNPNCGNKYANAYI